MLWLQPAKMINKNKCFSFLSFFLGGGGGGVGGFKRVHDNSNTVSYLNLWSNDRKLGHSEAGAHTTNNTDLGKLKNNGKSKT